MMQCGDQDDAAMTALTLTAQQCQVPAEHSSECLLAWVVMQSAGVGVVDDPLHVPGQTWKRTSIYHAKCGSWQLSRRNRK